LKTEGGEILLRTKGQAYRGEEFEKLVLLTQPDGTRITLGEVARVVDGFADTDQYARFNGKPAVLVKVFRTGDQSVLELADLVKDRVELLRTQMPTGIDITIWQDFSTYFKGRMDLLLKNGYTGLMLVFLVLALFLKFRLAIWVSIGIPISFLGAILVMPWLDASINMLSMFSFIVVLGIVVDDAIVVGESIYTEHQQGNTGLKGSIDGVHKVMTPVIFAVLTTVAAFSPMMFIPGFTGKIWRIIPFIVIPTLLFSLVESLLVLPNHLSHDKTGTGKEKKPRGFGLVWDRFQSFFAKGLERIAAKVYAPLLHWGLRWRYLTVAIGVFTLLVSIGMVAAGYVPMVFMPNVEADYVVAVLTMPLGTPVDKTEEALRRVESAALQLRGESDERVAAAGGAEDSAGSVFRQILTSVGEQPFIVEQQKNNGNSLATASGSNLGEVNIELAPSEERTLSSEEIVSLWRERVGDIPGITELTFTASLFSSGEDINIQLAGPNMEELISVAESLQERFLRDGS
jgi:multidrug efflux pump subunit AcrB